MTKDEQIRDNLLNNWLSRHIESRTPVTGLFAVSEYLVRRIGEMRSDFLRYINDGDASQAVFMSMVIYRAHRLLQRNKELLALGLKDDTRGF